MSTQFSSGSRITNNGTPRFPLKKMQQHPLRALAVILLLGAAAYFAYATIYAATYECQTETIGGLEKCHKYQIEPTFEDLGFVLNTACPNNPPSNCP